MFDDKLNSTGAEIANSIEEDDGMGDGGEIYHEAKILLDRS